MSPIKGRPMREINKHYFQKKRENHKVFEKLWNKNLHQLFNFVEQQFNVYLLPS